MAKSLGHKRGLRKQRVRSYWRVLKTKLACCGLLMSCQVILGQETSYGARDGRISAMQGGRRVRTRELAQARTGHDIWIITDGAARAA